MLIVSSRCSNWHCSAEVSEREWGIGVYHRILQVTSLESLAQEFKRFAEEECYESCSLYVRLSLGIAGDPEILAFAAHARKGEKVPNLFLAAVHFLLLKGIQHPLSLSYKSSAGTADWAEDPYPKFRSFCLEHIKEIRGLISTRSVQTNEVGRSVVHKRRQDRKAPGILRKPRRVARVAG